MNTQLRFILLNVLMVLAARSFGQKNWEANAGAAIGASLYPQFFKVIDELDQSESYNTRSGPAFTGFVENRFGRFISLQIAGGYQELNQDVKGFSFTRNGTTYTYEQFNYSLSRLNLGMGLRIYFDEWDNVDLYCGGRMGFSLFKFKISVDDTPLDNELKTNFGIPLTVPSFQVTLLGIKAYVTKNVGLFGEMGLGAPAYAQAGLCLRVPYTVNFKKTNSSE